MKLFSILISLLIFSSVTYACPVITGQYNCKNYNSFVANTYKNKTTSFYMLGKQYVHADSVSTLTISGPILEKSTVASCQDNYLTFESKDFSKSLNRVFQKLKKTYVLKGRELTIYRELTTIDSNGRESTTFGSDTCTQI